MPDGREGRINQTEYRFIRDLLLHDAGIELEDGSEDFVAGRLSTVVRETGASSLSEFMARVYGDPRGALRQRIVEACVTHETMFFRDQHPFDALRQTILPAVMDARRSTRTINIWSACCSSGQEPYSLAMLMAEDFPELDGWNVRILATDISRAVLQKARAGTYNSFEMNRGLSAEMRTRYFRPAGTAWQVKDELRRRIEFRELNLVEPWANLPSFDIVFMRNVLIYIEARARKDILRRVRETLKTDGYLFLGGTEPALDMVDTFEAEKVGRAIAHRPRAQIGRRAYDRAA